MTETPYLWYLNRASGLVLLVVLTITLVLGVLAAGRSTPPWWPRFATAALHANLAGVSVALLAAHVVTAVVDGFVDITPVDAVVPFLSSYRPLWLGLGTLASTLLVTAVVTAAGRGLLPPTVWRRTHLLVYPAWPLAVLHGLGTGSDTTRWPVLLLTFAALLAVVLAVVARLAVLDGPPAPGSPCGCSRSRCRSASACGSARPTARCSPAGRPRRQPRHGRQELS